MTLDDLLTIRTEKQLHLDEVAVLHNQANTKRREIEARYVIAWQSKPKAEALFIVNHKEDRENYQRTKEELIKAEWAEKRASKLYYQARDWQWRWDLVDSAISKLVNDNFNY